MKTNILFCGDAHGQLQHVVEAALRLKPMAVVLLGDIESPRPLHIELAAIRELVWWISGNHDSDRAASYAHLFESELADRCIDGKVVTLPDGTRLAGLGGVFREKIWYPPSPARHESYDDWLKTLQRGWQKREAMYQMQRLTHRSSIFPGTYLRLAAQRADILVTHEAGGSHPNGFQAIDELAAAMEAHTTFHGHQHDRLAYAAKWPSLGFRAFGVGLRGISDRNGEVVVPGELDAQRAGREVR